MVYAVHMSRPMCRNLSLSPPPSLGEPHRRLLDQATQSMSILTDGSRSGAFLRSVFGEREGCVCVCVCGYRDIM